jgi:hypothetical protein
MTGIASSVRPKRRYRIPAFISFFCAYRNLNPASCAVVGDLIVVAFAAHPKALTLMRWCGRNKIEALGGLGKGCNSVWTITWSCLKIHPKVAACFGRDEVAQSHRCEYRNFQTRSQCIVKD